MNAAEMREILSNTGDSKSNVRRWVAHTLPPHIWRRQVDEYFTEVTIPVAGFVWFTRQEFEHTLRELGYSIWSADDPLRGSVNYRISC